MKHFKIFLASPSDTEKERKQVQEVIKEMNKSVGKDEFHLDLFMWEENTYSSIGDDGQDVINKQNNEFDIFIGIMWKKFGTPTKRAFASS